jgi:hypothetical protein
VRAKGLLLSGLLLSPCAALAVNDDVLMQAVSFAVSGSDANKVVVVDRAQCIFKVKDDTYYFNNIYTDRVAFQYWKNKLGDEWATVDIHGKKKVVDHYSPPPTFTGSELDRQLMADNPNYFATKGQTASSSDETIRVNTRESDRLKKAWAYIYANGCKGMTSPF